MLMQVYSGKLWLVQCERWLFCLPQGTRSEREIAKRERKVFVRGKPPDGVHQIVLHRRAVLIEDVYETCTGITDLQILLISCSQVQNPLMPVHVS